MSALYKKRKARTEMERQGWEPVSETGQRQTDPRDTVPQHGARHACGKEGPHQESPFGGGDKRHGGKGGGLRPPG